MECIFLILTFRKVEKNSVFVWACKMYQAHLKKAQGNFLVWFILPLPQAIAAESVVFMKTYCITLSVMKPRSYIYIYFCCIGSMKRFTVHLTCV